jgi:hypothetical protein
MPGTTTRYGRLTVITTATAGAPAAWAIHPALSAVLAGLLAIVGLTLMGATLFGSERLSERAFRLLRWITDRPEPPQYRTQ